MIKDAVFTDEGTIACYTRFSPQKEPFLDGHRVEGVPLLPAVGAIETMSEAAYLASGAPYLTAIHNLKLVNGFRMPLDRDYFARVDTKVEENFVHCELKGDFYDKENHFIEPHRLYQSATIETSDQPLVFNSPAIQFPTNGEWIDIQYVDHWTKMNEGNLGTVYYGPVLQTVKRVQYAANGVWSQLVAPAPEELGGERTRNCRWHFPSALFDGLMFSADIYSQNILKSPPQLPSEAQLLQFAQMPEKGEPLIGWAEFLSEEKRKLYFNLFLFKTDGTLIFQCVNLNNVKL